MEYASRKEEEKKVNESGKIYIFVIKKGKLRTQIEKKKKNNNEKNLPTRLLCQKYFFKIFFVVGVQSAPVPFGSTPTKYSDVCLMNNVWNLELRKEKTKLVLDKIDTLVGKSIGKPQGQFLKGGLLKLTCP